MILVGKLKTIFAENRFESLDVESLDGADDAAANTAVLFLEGGVSMPSHSVHVSSSFHMDSSGRHLPGGAFCVCPFLNMGACSKAPYDWPLPRPINRTGLRGSSMAESVSKWRPGQGGMAVCTVCKGSVAAKMG